MNILGMALEIALVRIIQWNISYEYRLLIDTITYK